MARAGYLDVFHLEDGFLERFPVDARELVGLRQATFTPTEEEFRATAVKVRARGGKPSALAWPPGEIPPPWYAAALEPAAAPPAIPPTPNDHGA